MKSRRLHDDICRCLDDNCPKAKQCARYLPGRLATDRHAGLVMISMADSLCRMVGTGERDPEYSWFIPPLEDGP